MPHIRAGDIDIYYEIHGSGAPVLTMIRGLGADVTAWFSQIPELSRHFQLIVFDNRGAGRTDKPDAPYSTAQMAEDTKGLLDALDIPRTSVLGLSMGGMIAQEFAIRYPDRLQRLVLGCTAFGGPDFIAPPREVFAERGERTLFSDETIANNRSIIEAYNDAKSRFPIPPFALQRQLEAILRHDTANRVGQITAPTLVITGSEDRLIPPENSRLLAARLPYSLLRELPGGHLFASEHPDLFNRAVIDFLT
jgi:pimeloyl-ACP methyl ester carboxylesterase